LDKVTTLDEEDVTALVTAAATIESIRDKVPAVNTGATVTALLTITFALALLTVIKLGLPPKIKTKPAPVILVVPKSHTRATV
jgi:hypothetical protein